MRLLICIFYLSLVSTFPSEKNPSTCNSPLLHNKLRQTTRSLSRWCFSLEREGQTQLPSSFQHSFQTDRYLDPSNSSLFLPIFSAFCPRVPPALASFGELWPSCLDLYRLVAASLLPNLQQLPVGKKSKQINPHNPKSPPKLASRIEKLPPSTPNIVHLVCALISASGACRSLSYTHCGPVFPGRRRMTAYC